MEPRSRRGTGVLSSALWFVFFVTLIFWPGLVVRYPVLAAFAIGGCIWWAIQARRTRRRERRDLLDPQERR